MKFMLHHLTGSLRGQTQYFDADSLRFGTGKNCDVAFDPVGDSMVLAGHAEFSALDHIPTIRDVSGHNALFINNRLTVEAELHDGDLLQLGQGGPLVRFRKLPDRAAGAIKPWRYIVADSRDIAVRTPRRRYTSFLYLLQHIALEVARYGSPTVKSVAALLALVPIVLIVVLGVGLYYEYQAVTVSERHIAELLSQLETGQVGRAELEQRITDERALVAELRREQKQLEEKLREAVEQRGIAQRSQEELRVIQEQLATLESGQRFAEEVISRFETGVGLVQGGFGLKEKESGRPLRYKGFDQDGKPLLDEVGNPEVTLEGNSPQVLIFWAGTGFLIDQEGTVLTNRHIARLWEVYNPLQPFLETGFELGFQFLRIFFPGSPKPYELEVLAVADDQDLAIVRTTQPPKNVPALKLASREKNVHVGEPIIIMGYQGTFDSILGRLSPATSDEVLREVGTDPMALPEKLAALGLVRPLATQGYVTDVSHDVITYEARAVRGSSGGPVMDREGRVIAVNHSEVASVGGMNLGVPIDFVREQLAKVGDISKTQKSQDTEGR